MASMQFRTFVWPVAPLTLRIHYQRETKTKAASNGGWTVQNIALLGREFEGEGVFYGSAAYGQLQNLAALLNDGITGTLTIPNWGTAKALLTELTVTEEDGEGFIRYRYRFIEVP